MNSLQGNLLVASAGLFDPNFRRAVILVAHHDEEGAMGLVLNRPSDASVAEAVPPLADAVDPDERIHIGGPVQPESVMILGEFEDEEAGVPVFGTVGFLRSESEPEDVAACLRVRVFAGYAGWGAGQLEAELEEDSWVVLPARPEDVFGPSEGLFAAVLRRQGGRYRVLALLPDDPSVN
ncbi:MAG: YqgE/AlgH family protein [Actinomycetota bacterium]|nr:YqgE/AlgH family protein [Actinomycetota bacterium]